VNDGIGAKEIRDAGIFGRSALDLSLILELAVSLILTFTVKMSPT